MASVILQDRKRNRSGEESKTNASEKKHKTTINSSNGSVNGELITSLLEERKRLQSLSTFEFQKKKNEIEKEIKLCEGKRWMLNRLKDLETQKIEIEKKIKDIHDKKPLREFEKNVAPIMIRLNRTINDKPGIQRNHQRQEIERELRKKITKKTDAISLQRANNGDMCEDCGVSMKVIANDSLLGCPICAKSRIISFIGAPVADTEFVSIPYAQKSRLVEWLEFCQGKEYAEPSMEVLETIMEQLVSSKSTGLEMYAGIIAEERQKNGPFLDSENAIKRLGKSIPKLKEKLLAIKAPLVRNAMHSAAVANRDDKLRKFYERAPKYSSYMSGFWPLRFTNLQEERIKSLYAVAVPAYEKYRRPQQPNWPGGYAYFLRCICVLLGWDEFLDHFNITSGQKNIHEREAIREKIWKNDLDWEFVSTNPSTLLIKKTK